MIQQLLDLFRQEARSEWVRLRTLITLRWLAVAGQTGAVLTALLFFDLQLNVGLCFFAIGASVVFNLMAGFVLPETKRLTERQTLLILLFDVSQLAFLLYLTGGLNNPFALLILVPVTISASALTLGSTLIISATAIVLITVLAFFFVPLQTAAGEVLLMPPLFQLGIWIGLVIGLLFLGAYARRVTSESFSMSEALAVTQMALEREYALSTLGGVVAAAAHEMGTPLATIKLVSSELAEELETTPELRDDALLIKAQAERLAQILRDMGQTGKDDLQSKIIPFSTLVRQAAEPHKNRGITVHYFEKGKVLTEPSEQVPFVSREPEIVHGLRNLVQNAVDFAASEVWVDIDWNDSQLRVIISDDGRGFPAELLGRIGDPFIWGRSGRKTADGARPSYEGMGLGLFIAKTLLERRGAEIVFANGSKRSSTLGGAVVTATWNRSDIEKSKSEVRAALGPNRPNPN